MAVSFVVIFLCVIGLLFAAAFFTKRRIGVLGLGLVAGAMLSELWVGDITPIVAQAGIVTVKPPLESVVAAGLILLPALLLLFGGPTYKAKLQRVVGALVFAGLAVALLLHPLGSALVIEGPGEQVYAFFADNRTYIITAGVVAAVLDLLITRTPKPHKNGSKH